MRLRAPVPDDAPAVLAVVAARDLADLGVVDYTLEDLRDEWRGSELDLSRDARVVETDDGGIVAYAIVRRGGSHALVAPDHEGRGIGSRLLEWVERREHERGSDAHRQWVAANNAAARTLLSAAGYRVVRSNWRMARSLTDVPPAPPAPAGYELRPVDPGRDSVAIHAVDDVAFAGSPDYVPESLAEFTQEHLEAHDFEAGLSLVVTRGEEIVGFLLARRWGEENVGYVDILAVRPDHQGRGLGTALLQSAFAGFAAAGLAEAQLGVGSFNERGLHVYERAGMAVRHRADIYERPIES